MLKAESRLASGVHGEILLACDSNQNMREDCARWLGVSAEGRI